MSLESAGDITFLPRMWFKMKKVATGNGINFTAAGIVSSPASLDIEGDSGATVTATIRVVVCAELFPRTSGTLIGGTVYRGTTPASGFGTWDDYLLTVTNHLGATIGQYVLNYAPASVAGTGADPYRDTTVSIPAVCGGKITLSCAPKDAISSGFRRRITNFTDSVTFDFIQYDSVGIPVYEPGCVVELIDVIH
jgi:hypothetical protein